MSELITVNHGEIEQFRSAANTYLNSITANSELATALRKMIKVTQRAGEDYADELEILKARHAAKDSNKHLIKDGAGYAMNEEKSIEFTKAVRELMRKEIEVPVVQVEEIPPIKQAFLIAFTPFVIG